MFLKSVEVFGFKSFADKSRIEFSPGISALLGPNGCGKSNVVDAIKWVLGEQASRSLRAERMEDVIFNGTDTRKQLNVAEVSLTLSNDTGLLPMDVPEVEVKRRLFRSGTSEYFINGAPVRLKDLRELFYDTGIGKSAYSIMEQGKIDQVLSTKPEERRTIFEEAATITKYKMKGAEAERKLERTVENMNQVRNILAEVEKRYKTLEKQAAKTERYRELKDQIFHTEVDQTLLKLRKLINDRDKTVQQLQDSTAERDKLKQNIDQINESLEEHMEEVHSMEERLVEAQKNLYRLEVEQKSTHGRRTMLVERLEEVQSKIETETGRLEGLRQTIARIETGISEKETQAADTNTRIAELETNIKEFEESIETASRRIADNEQQAVRLNDEVASLENEQEVLGEELRGVTDVIVQELDERLRESGYSSRRRQELEAQMRHLLSSIRITLEGKRDVLGDLAGRDTVGSGDLSGIIEALQGLPDRVAEAEELLNQYHDATPAFLDDFLAPEGIITRKREIDERIAACRDKVRDNRSAITTLQEENRELQRKRDEYRRTLEELRLNRVQLQNQLQTITQEIERDRRSIEQQQRRCAEIEEGISIERDRIQGLNEHIEKVDQQSQELTTQEAMARKELEQLNSEISSRNKSVLKNERQVKDQMQSLAKLQEKVERIHLREAEIKADIRNLYENFRDRHSRDLSEFEERTFEIGEQYSEVRDALQRLRSELKELGQVNLMAPEEFAEVEERYNFLTSQLDDLGRAKQDLDRITAEIRKESTQLFLETYEKIKRNFHTLFRRLFGGGRAEIRLVDPDDVLESGIEILAQPPGKKLENINLLSGGERSMTAVALLFATYMVKPSPFCLLDEIDAALDEENVGRFVGVLTEFAKESQFIVITHNKKTVGGAQTLLGVTMEESGVSKVISIRLDTRSEGDEPAEEEAVAELT
ncbi:chromosome segregation SMC family protein [Spirochaeta africana]|uniref:Chromosome partition protein Smc n=1 Tax=Spirochaeta africana (strain ATCC 700263 / DSM 8902 / Z-7692) TaxID=889378 RepID=H9UIE2_SPIAZ|nr:AAA family ATPase [Spirochaeta africana]AFG37285.1 RecF/RecN/SMC N-terminal domain-containing protein [Spirochaeta africana DSM 8902]